MDTAMAAYDFAHPEDPSCADGDRREQPSSQAGADGADEKRASGDDGPMPEGNLPQASLPHGRRMDSGIHLRFQDEVHRDDVEHLACEGRWSGAAFATLLLKLR